MRATFGRYFDVIVVVWVLSLGIAWSVYALGHAPVGGDRWSLPNAAPAWYLLDAAPVATLAP